MSNQRTLLLFTIICALVAQPIVTLQEQLLQANWRPCGGTTSDQLKTSQIGTDLEVYIGPCQATNGTESRCLLQKGTNATMTIKFKATESVPSLERIIVARVPAALDKKVEMPYGPPISPCQNSSMVATDGTECVEQGVEANKSYTYVSLFEVLKSFPSVQDVETRIILRKRHDKHRKIRLYRKHPGPTVFCVLIPHIEVID